ncbi:MAG: methionine--tRNA ligase [Deltaproteobacteria bacterium]|nr:MAG: methionine--tRNA ligase [Deltaproteobacteria bacterium]
MRDERTFTITTPIYYVNGRPHIGHAYTTIAADTIARYRRMKGHEVFFLTGTDEHGQKVLERATERGMDPKAHCDDMVVHWKAMMEKLGISYDRFIRTTDADHIATVTTVLQRLFDQDLIYKDTYKGWYHVSDEIFVTEKDIEEGKYDKSELREIEETNYFFKMGSYQQQLIDAIESNPTLIQPESRKNEVLGFLRKTLGDLCISRPKSRMSWGIELPFDDEFVTYVWFDALLNYLSGLGYDGSEGCTAHLKWWPANYHLIGKDILTTHSVYWSTMLFAIGQPLVQTLYAHGWWVSADGAKMSKSKGNVIDVDVLVDNYGVDATRYFFLREISFGADGGFTYEGFQQRYNVDLANDFGNLTHRGLSMALKWLGESVPPVGERTEAEAAIVARAREAVVEYDAQMEALQYNKALEAVISVVDATNKYIDTQEPWAINKRGDTARLQTVMRTLLEVSVYTGVLLAPFMPAKSAELLGKFGLDHDDAKRLLGAWLDDGPGLDALVEGAPVSLGEPLFPRFRQLPEAIVAMLTPDPTFEEWLAEQGVESVSDATKDAWQAMYARRHDEEKATKDLITFDDFGKLDLRAGLILEAGPHPKADRLLVLKVDVGEHKPRQVVAGIASKYAPEELVGKRVVVVCNLKPAKLRGVMSEAMLMAAGEKEVVDLASVVATPGEVVR